MGMRAMALIAGLTAAPVSSGQISRMMVYGDDSTNTPRSNTWSGSAWGTEAATLDLGGSPRWVLARACPARSELVAAVLDNQNDVNVMVYSASAWGNSVEVTSNTVTNADRPCDIAYEQTSGKAMVMYRVGSTGVAYYRTWNGAAWSAQTSTAYSGAGDPKYVRLVPKPGSNEIMALILDNASDISAMVWDGSSFGNKVLLEANAESAGTECFDGAYESGTGRCIVTWAVSGTSVPAYRVWTGSAWLAAGTLPDVGGSTKWLRLAADSASNTIIAMTLDGGSDVNATVWSGSAWGAVSEFETSAPDTDRRGIDVAFEPCGTTALAMYGRSGVNTPFYRTFSGSAWSVAVAGPNLSYRPGIIQLSPSASGHEVLVGVRRNTDGALCFMKWTGSVMSGLQTLYADLPGPNTAETFMLISGITTPAPRVTSWQEVDPGS